MPENQSVWRPRLWFDVERGCNTTDGQAIAIPISLWFDVERGCNTTDLLLFILKDLLWFDVERGCNTTEEKTHYSTDRCGLM